MALENLIVLHKDGSLAPFSINHPNRSLSDGLKLKFGSIDRQRSVAKLLALCIETLLN